MTHFATRPLARRGRPTPAAARHTLAVVVRAKPVGVITRGTTNPNRLRRGDRWLAGPEAWRLRQSATAPLVVDLGYGASPITTLELRDRLRAVRPDVRVLGIEIEPARVRAGQDLVASLGDPAGLDFRLGGFEIPTDGGERPVVVRAFNVLRQYDESEVAGAWARMVARLAPDGLLLDGTCDELGRIASWVAVDAHGPQSLTVSLRLRDLDRPGVVAERLPKALIHRNVPGERVHAFLGALDEAWRYAAPLAAYGVRPRFVQAVCELKAAGWPILGPARRWRLGEVTVAWAAVAPTS